MPYRNPTELSLVVYRNDKRVLELNFTNWPSARNPAGSESREIAAEILGPDPGAVLKQPVLNASAFTSDRVAKLEKELIPQAQAGDVDAQFALAALYQFGAADPNKRPIPMTAPPLTGISRLLPSTCSRRRTLLDFSTVTAGA